MTFPKCQAIEVKVLWAEKQLELEAGKGFGMADLSEYGLEMVCEVWVDWDKCLNGFV